MAAARRGRCRRPGAPDPPERTAVPGRARAQRVRRQHPAAHVGDEAAALQDRPVPVRRRLPRVHVAARRARPSRRVRRHRRHAGDRARRARRRARAAVRRPTRRAGSRAAASIAWRGSSSAARTRPKPWRASPSCGTAATRRRSTCSARRRSPSPMPTRTPSGSGRCSTRSRRRRSGVVARSRCSNTIRGAPLPRVNISVKASALAPLLAPATADEGDRRSARTARPDPRRGARRGRDDPPRHRARRAEGRRRSGCCARSARATPKARSSAASSRRTASTPSTTSATSSSGRPTRSSARCRSGCQGRLLGRRDDQGARARAGSRRCGRTRTRPTRRTNACASMLVANAGDVRPAFASHNARSIAWALCAARARRACRRRGRGAGAARHGRTAARGRAASSACARACTCRSATWCRAWPTSCDACSRTRRTSRSCATATPKGWEVDALVAPPRPGARVGPRPPARAASADRPRRARPLRQRAAGRAAARRRPQTGSSTRRPRRDASSASGFRCSSTASRSTPATPIVSVDPGRPRRDGVPQRVGRASSTSNAAIAAAVHAGARMARDVMARPRRRAVPRRRPHAPAAATSSRRCACSKRASRSPKPTPTCAKRSTSASTTAGARSQLGDGRAACSQPPGEANDVPVPTARRRRRHRAVELPARDPDRHGDRGARDRQHRRVQARGADARASRRGSSRSCSRPGSPPGALAFLPGVGEEIGPRSSSIPTSRSSRSPDRRRSASTSCSARPIVRPGQRHVKRVVAEMGGKNAIIVDADADLDDAVPAIVQSAFGYAGQKCSAASRVVVVDDIYDALAERLAGAVELVPIGHPRDPATVVGPLIDADALRTRPRLPGASRQPTGACSCSAPTFPRPAGTSGRRSSSSTDARSRDRDRRDLRPGARAAPRARLRPRRSRSPTTPTTRSRPAASRARRHTSSARRGELRAGNVYLNRAITGAVVGRQPFGGFGLSGVGLEGRRPRLPAPVRRAPLDQREHPPPRASPRSTASGAGDGEREGVLAHHEPDLVVGEAGEVVDERERVGEALGVRVVGAEDHAVRRRARRGAAGGRPRSTATPTRGRAPAAPGRRRRTRPAPGRTTSSARAAAAAPSRSRSRSSRRAGSGAGVNTPWHTSAAIVS